MPWHAIEVEIHDGNALPLDVLPHVHLGPVQERVHADVRVGREFGVMQCFQNSGVARRCPTCSCDRGEVAGLLGSAAFFVGPRADDDAGEGRNVGVADVAARGLIEAIAAHSPLNVFVNASVLSSEQHVSRSTAPAGNVRRLASASACSP